MKKLMLDARTLSVQSFPTLVVPRRQSGTTPTYVGDDPDILYPCDPATLFDCPTRRGCTV
jgi:hypothetical protein